ncbi:hypothetical protein [Stenotrophomonas maltophilia]|uniref:hypothetical protein n=1 Tax=Stenotrophomonas maltophilia TaxID=40324 RepID=UPI002B1D8BC9|nr:hypothetical protein [Stenotrophomonas maltophilia]
MLKFHFLNVGHGNSTVIEYTSLNGHRHFGVIDSNRRGQEQPAALRRLAELDAGHLAFVALTHPHADHYKGLAAVMAAYAGRVDRFFSFPLDRDVHRLTKWLTNFQDLALGVTSREVLGEIDELLDVVLGFDNAADDWEPLSNYESVAYVPGMSDEMRISVLLPPAKVKGPFFERIANNESAYKCHKDNALSLAFKFEYAGRVVVVGGDGTWENWVYIRQRTRKAASADEFGSLHADVACLPHHGSAKDSGPDVLDFIFGTAAPSDGANKIAVISADGRSHPAPEVLKHLRLRGVHPYCTGLSKVCSHAQPLPTADSNVLDPVLMRYIAMNAIPNGRPALCQGNVTVGISPAGEISVLRQFNNLCPLRGDLDFVA